MVWLMPALIDLFDIDLQAPSTALTMQGLACGNQLALNQSLVGNCLLPLAPLPIAKLLLLFS